MCGGNVRVRGGVAVHGCMTEQVRERARGKPDIETRRWYTGPGMRGEESAVEERRQRDKRQKCAQCHKEHFHI